MATPVVPNQFAVGKNRIIHRRAAFGERRQRGTDFCGGARGRAAALKSALDQTSLELPAVRQGADGSRCRGRTILATFQLRFLR